LPFVEGEFVEVTDSSKRYRGMVSKITTNFTILYSSDSKNEIILSNNSIVAGQFIIIKEGPGKK
jgi:small-conductance mechanosensitive channel